MAHLDSRDPQPWIDRLNTHLGEFGHQSLWSMEPVLDGLAERLDLPAFAMMLSLYRVVSGTDEVSALGEYDWWSRTGRAPAA